MSDEHPAVLVKATLQGRRAVLASRPGLQAVLRYYADYREEVDQDFKAHLEAQQNHS